MTLEIFDKMDQRSPDGHRLARYRCSCGNLTVVAITRVKNGRTRSCGCLNQQATRMANTTHGKRKSLTYSSWQAMLARCHNPNSKDYRRYGAVGIIVCDEWRNSFATFHAHIGDRPKGTTIDRIDTKLGYVPGNVRWATPTLQAQNRPTSFVWTIKGLTFDSAEEAATHFKRSDNTIHRWAKGSFDKRRGRSTPARDGCYVTPRY